MLAQNDEYIKEASTTIYELTQEEKIRLQCEAREDYYRRQRSNTRRYEAACTELANTKNKLADANAKIAEQASIIADLTAQLDVLKK